jgi:hypothetical protein
MCGFIEGHTLAGLNLICKAPDKNTQQADLIPEDYALRGLQAAALGKGEIFGIKAVLSQRLMAPGTSLMRLVAAQLDRVGITWLTSRLPGTRLGCVSRGICCCRH